MNTTEQCLMTAIMKASVDLISTYDAGFTDSAIKTRMLRIGEDLWYAVEQCDECD